MLAWYLNDKYLPPSGKTILTCSAILLIPVIMIAKQPDLGTAIIIAFTGIFVLLLAGIRWKLIWSILGSIAIFLPILWHFMHAYQKNRILTFLDPTRDPRGAGYHIIQSKIAIGSGGFWGEGWLHGTQTHLQFLPEHSTDFIFGVCGEELGFIGCILLLSIFMYIICRGLYISRNAHDTFTRLLAGSLSLTFFISFFVNIGMVIGVLPVVGLPLPLVSYGGSSLVTLMAGFGIIMSVQTHKKLIAT
jgi:rod shape determining protein RodA